MLHIRKLTQEAYRQRIAGASPNVILLSPYVKFTEKLSCRCRVCGYEWTATPSVLLRGAGTDKNGGGCPKCANRVRKTDEEFKQELAKIRPNILVESEYQNANKPIRCRCKNCGYTWVSTPHILLHTRDSNCPAEAANRKKTTEEFAEELSSLNPNLKLLSPYVTARKSIWVRCLIHDLEWRTNPDSLLRFPHCRECSNEKLRAERTKSHKTFLQEMATVNEQILIIGEYAGSETRIACRCKKCAHEWVAMPCNLLAGYGCPVCAGTKRLTRKELSKRLKEIQSDFVVVGKYKSRKKKLTVQCSFCGQFFEMTPENLLRGTRCSCQWSWSTSRQEEFLAKLLEKELQEKPYRHDRKLIGAELDMLFPEHRIAVEPGSWYYHQDKLLRDQEKRKSCMEHGVRLITVYYGVNGEYCSNENDVLIFDSDCVKEEDMVHMGEKLIETIGAEVSERKTFCRNVLQESMREQKENKKQELSALSRRKQKE